MTENLRTKARKNDMHRLIGQEKLKDKRDIELLNKVIETMPNKEWEILLEHIVEDNARM